MTKSTLSLEEQIRRKDKIIQALMARLERGDELGHSHFSLFQSAITLQQQVESKTEDLNQALEALGATSYKLKDAYLDQKRAHQNLSSAMEALDEGFALFQDEKLVICNNRFKNLLPDVSEFIETGLGFDDYIERVSKSKYVRIGLESEQANWRQMRKTLHQQPLSSFVISLSDDRWYQISDRQSSFGSIAILQTDITDIIRENRMEKKQLIDEHQTYVQNSFDHLPIGIASLSEDFRVQVFNLKFAELLTLPLTQIQKGTNFQRLVERLDHKQIFAPREIGAGFSNWFAEFASQNALQHKDRKQVILDRVDGKIIEFQINSLPSGGFIANAIDITTQMQAADALATLNANLEARVETRTRDLERANQKLRLKNESLAAIQIELQSAKEAAEQANFSKSRFLAAASHDLMQPISAAKLYISLLKNPDNKKHLEYISRLWQNFESVEHLITDLLDMSRLDSQQPKFNTLAFSMASLFKRLRENLEPLAQEKSLDLRFVNSSDWVYSDKHYAYRILQNLIVNAIQNSAEGKILVGCRHDGDRIWVHVLDQGYGIKDDDLSRIFEEFTQLDNAQSHRGVGLGLSIVERACRHLKLPMRVHSEWQRGTGFAVGFPLTEKPVNTQIAPSKPNALVNRDFNFVIFVIENDLETLNATTEVLQFWGADVIAVTSTRDAINQFAELDEEPALIIADYQLNNDDLGTGAIRALRARSRQNIPAILMTANKDPELHDQQSQQDFTLLAKPLNPELLQVTIEKLLNENTLKPQKIRVEKSEPILESQSHEKENI